MDKFNKIHLVALFLLLNTVKECWSASTRNRCPTIHVDNGRVRTRQSGQVARITCNSHFKLVHGNEIANCIRGEWDSEFPICAQTGCPIMERIPHGILNVFYGGAKLEVTCNLGYSIDGPSFVYCNENLEWNEELRGCKEDNQIYLSCDFESSDDRLCGWKNDIFNDVDWLADKMSFLLFSSRRHVPSGSSQYFSSNYISLDAGNYGSSTTGRLLSPPILPFKTKQRCLIFSYKVTSGSSYGPHILKVTFGGIPHWATSKGEGKVIIGLYKSNITSYVIIEGKNCKAAIDNLIITDGDFCAQQPYEEEIDSCHDNCGKITNGNGCSCDWDCHNNNDCCPDLKIHCPYIKPFEEIARLYLSTTAVTKPSTVKSTTLNVSVSSSKIINESKTLNDLIIETTPMIDHHITMNTTISNVTQPISMSNITHLTFPPTPPLTSTIKPITLTVKISSTLTSNKFLKLNYTSSINSSLPINGSSMASTLNKQFITVSDITVANITSITPKIADRPSTIIKFILTNTNAFTPVVTNVPSSTTKLDIFNTTTLHTKLFNSSDMNVKLVLTNKTNATTPTSITSSTFKPVTVNAFPFAKKLSNFSTISHKLLTKYNTSINFEPSNNTFNSVSKLPNVQKTIQNIVTTDNKSTIITDHIPTLTSPFVDSFNHSAVSKDKMVVVDTFYPNSSLITSKYSTALENGKILLNNNNLSNVTVGSFNHSEHKLNTFLKKVKLTKVDVPNEKLDLNVSFYNQSTVNGSKQMTEYVKLNKNAKKPGILINIASAFKYIAVIGAILMTFKFTLSFVRWYFKKPTNDEMNTCFVETDKESDYNIELVSNT